jgi:hypothetical protein
VLVGVREKEEERMKMKGLVIFTLIWFFVVCKTVEGDEDPCQFSENLVITVKMANISRVSACVNALPFDEKLRSGTLTQLRNLIKLYAFGDLASHSGYPFYIQVDLEAELDEIETKNYTSDWEFESDIVRLFNRLGDAHTLFYGPSCYQLFFFWHPFILNSTVVDGRHVIVAAGESTVDLGPVVLRFSTSTNLTNLPYFIGKQIVRVGNLKVTDWIQVFECFFFIFEYYYYS